MLLSLLIIWVILCCFIYKRIIDSLSKNVALIYTAYWMGSLILAKLNPFDYYEVSDETIISLAIHVVAFILGFGIVKSWSCAPIHNGVKLSVLPILKNSLFRVVYVISTIFVIVLFIRQWRALAAIDLMDVRGDFMDIILKGNGLAYLYHNVVATGLYYFSLSLVVYMLLFERKWLYILLLAFYVVVYASIGGGRSQFMFFAYYGLGIFLLSDIIASNQVGVFKKIVIPLKMKILIGITVVFLVVAMSFVSAFRRGHSEFNEDALREGSEELLMTFGEYSAGPIVAFDIAMREKHTYNPGGKLYYGTATLSGFDYLWWILLHRFGLMDKTAYHTTTSVLQNEIIKISPERGWNYAYTSCMYYYYDFGYVGIVMMPLVLGFFARKLIVRIYDSITFYDISLFIFLTICLWMSVFAGHLHKIITPFFICFMLVQSRREKRKFRNLQRTI